MTQAVVGGVTNTYTYAGASQSQVLSETKGGSTPIATKLVYGRTEQPEQYNVNILQAYVFDDPTTVQATSWGRCCLESP